MRRIHAVLVLLAVLVIGSFSLIQASTLKWVRLPGVHKPNTVAVAGAQCECQYTSGSYGVLCPSEGCCVVDCWNPIKN